MIRWARRRIARDQSALAQAGAGQGALRVLYGAGTARHSRPVAEALRKAIPAGSPLHRRYRVEPTSTGHVEIPAVYGWRLLADAAADLPGVPNAPRSRGPAVQGTTNGRRASMRAEFEIQPETFEYEAEPGEFAGWQAEAPRARRTGGANAPIRHCVKQPTRVDCPDPNRSPPPDEIVDGFRFDRSRLSSTHKTRVGIVAQKIVQSLTTNRPIRTVLVAGHTDRVGDDNYNFGLGWRRATAVMEELCRRLEGLRRGITGNLNLELTSCGERWPKGTAPQSRRVEIFFKAAMVPSPQPPRPQPQPPRPQPRPPWRPQPQPRPPQPPQPQPQPPQPQPQPQPPQPAPAGQCRFRPSLHGFRFANYFTLPSVITSALSRLGISVGSGAYGLCGGMSFLAADLFSFRLARPSASSVPPTGSRLYLKLVERQLNSLKLKPAVVPIGPIPLPVPMPGFAAPVMKFWVWMGLPDRGRGSVAQKTSAEVATVNATMRRGRFAVLGLVLVNRSGSLTDNHQVLAYCVTQRAPNTFEYAIYDPNYPLRDDIRIEVQIVGGEARVTQVIPAAGGGSATRKPIRGFFNMPYSPARP